MSTVTEVLLLPLQWFSPLKVEYIAAQCTTLLVIISLVATSRYMKHPGLTLIPALTAIFYEYKL